MALNGTISGAYKGWTYRIEWSATQDVTNNTSTITCVHKLVCAKAYDLYVSARTNKCTVDGTSVNYRSPAVATAGNQTITLGTTTHTVTHNDDGSKSCAVSAYYYVRATLAGTYKEYFSVSGTIILDTIARASQPSLITWPENTQDVGDFGTTISIHMNRKSDDFTHTVRYEFGSLSGTIATGVTTGTTWTIPLSLMNEIPYATSGSGRVYVDTYNGSTLIGTKYSGFTATVPSSVKPTCSATLEDVMGIDDIYGSPVKGLSKIKVTVTAVNAYSSPIQAFSVVIDGMRYSSSTVTTGYLRYSGTSTVTVTVTDYRGRSGTWTYDMTVQAYSSPSISKLSVIRCNSDGTANKRGAYVKATFSAAVSSMDGKNTASYAIKYKKTSDDAYTQVNFTKLANNYAPTNSTHIFAAETGSSYNVMILAWDRHNSSKPTTMSAKAPTASTIFSWRGFKTSSGTDDGFGIGRVPDKANTLQVAWDSEFEADTIHYGDTVHKGNQYAFYSPGTAGSAGYVRIARLTHKKANADTPITFVLTRRLEATPMTVHVQFESNSTTVDPGLKGITYEGSNYGAFLTHAEESVWDLYVEKVSAYDTVTMNTWFSSGTIYDRLTMEFPGDLATEVPQGTEGYYRATPAKLQSLLDHIYPINAIYIGYSHTSPASLFGGTWYRISNAFLWATDSSGIIGQVGGAKTVTLTESEIPAHTHTGLYYTQNGNPVSLNTGTAGYKLTWTANAGRDDSTLITDSTGGGGAHNNMPPYVQVAVWRRTA